MAERLASEFDHAFSALARNFAGERGRVVIGALLTVAAGILPAVLATFRQEYPTVEIILRDRLSGNLLEQLQSREIEVAHRSLEAPVAKRTIGIARFAERSLNPGGSQFSGTFQEIPIRGDSESGGAGGAIAPDCK